jgi:predicted transcriptional regulator
VYDKTRALAENKLIILYLIEKIEIPLSNSEICQFALEKNLMDYFSVQQYLSELVESNLLEMTAENNSTRYTITNDGEDILNYFTKHISNYAKTVINTYAKENSKRIRAEYSITANYFQEMNNEYTVKCGVYDSDGMTSLMEISINVATKDQARLVCRNWKNNVTDIYGQIMHCLSTEINDDKSQNK